MNTEVLLSIRAQTLERIQDLTASPKPTYTIDGQNIDWNEYLEQLRQTVDWIDAYLNRELPFELVSQAVPK